MSSTFESLIARDRLWIALALGATVLLCWAWIVPAALDMQGSMRGLAAWMMQAHWDLRYFALMFGMWVVMMAGMMLPSAAPALLLYGRIVRSDARVTQPLRRVYAFAAGYLAAWCGFSLLATLLQWSLAESSLLTPMLRLHSAALGSLLLAFAGAYQLTPLKRVCLAGCRSPGAYISSNWRPGFAGALRLGFGYGLYCLGCCWALMLLLFVGGIMSLVWIAAITLAVLVEKLAPFGAQSARAGGMMLIVAALALGVSALRS